ncbi:MAG TPA: hypothetical protein VHE80_11725, partial [Acidimicrobiales bacterium]|nr:hypothetical protein [Acidimicrobiales bacterium]
MPARRLLACAAVVLVSASAACGGGDGDGDRRESRRRHPTTSSTSAPTTTTTTVPAVMDLRPDGLGPIRFGDDAEPALAALVAVLGPPQSDSGFTTTVEGFASCPGDRVRAVRWRGLTVLLARGRTDLRSDGQPHVIA